MDATGLRTAARNRASASPRENQETPDTVRVSIDCAQGYTWLDVTRFGDIWRVTNINAA
ncbi:hypothetical protein [Streptomyces sp. c-19]|uniref:hypothetical protein n=1 Tax=Streptomyces sp. c-19 TaxID=2789275 RepID=UPI0039801586